MILIIINHLVDISWFVTYRLLSYFLGQQWNAQTKSTGWILPFIYFLHILTSLRTNDPVMSFYA